MKCQRAHTAAKSCCFVLALVWFAARRLTELSDSAHQLTKLFLSKLDGQNRMLALLSFFVVSDALCGSVFRAFHSPIEPPFEPQCLGRHRSLSVISRAAGSAPTLKVEVSSSRSEYQASCDQQVAPYAAAVEPHTVNVCVDGWAAERCKVRWVVGFIKTKKRYSVNIFTAVLMAAIETLLFFCQKCLRTLKDLNTYSVIYSQC